MKNIRELLEVFVCENYGKEEVENPSWDIDELAGYLEKNLGMDFESKKKRIKDCFLENLRAWQRVNTVTDKCRDIIFDENGNYIDGGRELADYLTRLDKKAIEIEERKPDYSELDDVE